MGKLDITADKKQAGFTLVELAVVMIIIGLLIGGVLKGQELIANAQITSTANAVKGIDAATTTFRDSYNFLPGDMPTAISAARLTNCGAAPCNNNGNADSRVGANGFSGGAQAGENLAFWAHLSSADLISGIDNNGGLTFGGQLPAAPISGGFAAGFDNTGVLGSNAASRAGHYLMLFDNAAGGSAATALSAQQAARLDRKMDDGVSNTGTVFDTGACGNAAGIYQEGNATLSCDLFVRFQN